uniref:Uncharacterized protein n=1 Tax=Oryza sativa subsp. japonica TaxID=39947 RepID=Q8GVR7_ORYSJ|nr:hypothetical protein [Oryza sativa Japonica Group]
MAWRRRRSRGGLNPVATDDVEDDGDSAKDGGGHRAVEGYILAGMAKIWLRESFGEAVGDALMLCSAIYIGN